MPNDNQLDCEIMTGNEKVAGKICESLDELDRLIAENKSVETKVEETLAEYDVIQAEKLKAGELCSNCSHRRDVHGEWWSVEDDRCLHSNTNGACSCTAFVELKK